MKSSIALFLICFLQIGTCVVIIITLTLCFLCEILMYVLIVLTLLCMGIICGIFHSIIFCTRWFNIFYNIFILIPTFVILLIILILNCLLRVKTFVVILAIVIMNERKKEVIFCFFCEIHVLVILALLFKFCGMIHYNMAWNVHFFSVDVTMVNVFNQFVYFVANNCFKNDLYFIL